MRRYEYNAAMVIEQRPRLSAKEHVAREMAADRRRLVRNVAVTVGLVGAGVVLSAANNWWGVGEKPHWMYDGSLDFSQHTPPLATHDLLQQNGDLAGYNALMDAHNGIAAQTHTLNAPWSYLGNIGRGGNAESWFAWQPSHPAQVDFSAGTTGGHIVVPAGDTFSVTYQAPNDAHVRLLEVVGNGKSSIDLSQLDHDKIVNLQFQDGAFVRRADGTATAIDTLGIPGGSARLFESQYNSFDWDPTTNWLSITSPVFNKLP